MRCAGTNFSSITKVLLPVPASPTTCQSSTMVMSLFGTSTEQACLRSPCSIDAGRHHPVGVIDAAGELMAAAPDDAAVDGRALAGRRARSSTASPSGPCPRRLPAPAPNRTASLSDVVGEHHVHPGLRAAAARQRLAHLAQHVVAVLEAAVARRLADAQQIVGEIVADGLVRAAAQRLGFRGAFLQHRHQRLGAAQQFLARGGRGRASWRPCFCSITFLPDC